MFIQKDRQPLFFKTHIVRYITKDTSNRLKFCCISDKDFQISTDYLFTFKNRFCGNEYTMNLQGVFCGSCAEFTFIEDCNTGVDISIPIGLYCLVVTKSTDQSILFKTDEIRVQ